MYTCIYIYSSVCIHAHGWGKTNLRAPIYEHTYTHIYGLLAFLGALYLTLCFTDKKCRTSGSKTVMVFFGVVSSLLTLQIFMVFN